MVSVGSVLEAVDAFLDGAHTVAVPIRERWRGANRGKLCWLTVEDVVRFLLSSVGVFSATASRPVSELGAVRPAALAVAAGDSALSAVPLIVDDNGRKLIASPAARSWRSDGQRRQLCATGEARWWG